MADSDVKDVPDVDVLIAAAKRLIHQVSEDNSRHGGLSSMATVRAADELRLVISKGWNK